MKILIVNDYYTYGGTEVQCIREQELLNERKNECYLLTFDSNLDDAWINNRHYNIKLHNKGIAKAIRKLFIDPLLISKIRKILSNISPDVIHINNLYLATFSQYKALEGYKVVQTLRDYSAVCYKSTCTYNDFNICNGYNHNKCIKECSKNHILNYLKYFRFIQTLNLKRKYVKGFITPSEKLKEYSLNNGYKNVYCVNDCFESKEIKHLNLNEKYKNKKYLYFGAIDEVKGIFKFIDVFKKFAGDKNIELYIAGKGNQENLKILNKKINGDKKITYLGCLEYAKVLEVLSSVYVVVVPSLWMENYPNTVLEAMAYKCLVLGSNRGGIPEMINEKGIIFDILDNKSVGEALNKSYELGASEIIRLTDRALEYVRINNSKETYYNKLMKIFKDFY